MRPFRNPSATLQFTQLAINLNLNLDTIQATTRFYGYSSILVAAVIATCRKVVMRTFDQVDPRTRDMTPFYDSL